MTKVAMLDSIMEKQQAGKITIEEYSKVLEDHDWYFSYSDDHRVWKKGHDQSTYINKLAAQDPALKQVLQQFLRARNMMAESTGE